MTQPKRPRRRLAGFETAPAHERELFAPLRDAVRCSSRRRTGFTVWALYRFRLHPDEPLFEEWYLAESEAGAREYASRARDDYLTWQRLRNAAWRFSDCLTALVVTDGRGQVIARTGSGDQRLGPSDPALPPF